jgi:N-acyl-D-amino-acid deacylase
MTSGILLRGGLVADGIAAAASRADVLIDGELISRMAAGIEPPPGCAVMDLAEGSVVCPGFIDAHVHAEGPLLADGRIDGALAQGVTTLVVGQDGQSWIGASPATVQYLNQYFGPVNGTVDPSLTGSVAAYHDAVRGRLTQNVAILASQGTIRHNVTGLSPGPLGRDELATARRELENALADGAVGLSSGLDYLPSRLGTVEEVASIARPLAAAGRPYVSHLRGYGSEVKSGLDELVAVGQRAGIRVHASHLWGLTGQIRESLNAAGIPVSYDMYPYRKSSTILAMLILPADLQTRGPEHTLAALRDPGQRASLLAGEKLSDTFLRDVYLGCLPASLAEFAGLAVTEAADRSSRRPGEWVLDLLADAGLGVGGHLNRPAFTGAELAWLVSDTRFCAGSDGIYQGQRPHPRGYGTFARLARHYLAHGPETGSQLLARHLAANTADAYGLRDRGRLAPGMAADMCVIGPAGIKDRATYSSPERLATGVDLVIVNGIIAWRGNQPVTAEHPGKLVS